MKKLMCLIALALVISTSVPTTIAQQDPPIIVGGGGRAAAQAPTPKNPFAEFQSVAKALTVRNVVMLIGVM